MGLYINGKNVIPMGLIGHISANSQTALERSIGLSNQVSSLQLSIQSESLSVQALDGHLSYIQGTLDQSYNNSVEQKNKIEDELEPEAERLEHEQDNIEYNLDFLSGQVSGISSVLSVLSTDVWNNVSVNILTSDNTFTGFNTFSNGLSVNSLSSRNGQLQIDMHDVLFFQDVNDRVFYSMTFHDFFQQISSEFTHPL